MTSSHRGRNCALRLRFFDILKQPFFQKDGAVRICKWAAQGCHSQVVGGVQPMQGDALPASQKAKSASEPGAPLTAPHLEP